MKKKYLKPIALFKGITLNENISDICWAYAAGHVGTRLYWDKDGPSEPGYVTFYFATKTNCKADLTSSIIVETWSPFLSKDAARAAIIALPGGSNAQPFKGAPFSESAPKS